MSAYRYLPAAQNVARAFPNFFIEKGLDPLISRYVLTESARGDAWLFVVMDASVSENLESYASPNLLSDLSATFHGYPVLFSNASGLRYAVLLNQSKIG